MSSNRYKCVEPPWAQKEKERDEVANFGLRTAWIAELNVWPRFFALLAWPVCSHFAWFANKLQEKRDLICDDHHHYSIYRTNKYPNYSSSRIQGLSLNDYPGIPELFWLVADLVFVGLCVSSFFVSVSVRTYISHGHDPLNYVVHFNSFYPALFIIASALWNLFLHSHTPK